MTGKSTAGAGSRRPVVVACGQPQPPAHAARTLRVTAVVPCWNRRDDLIALLGDLAAQRPAIGLNETSESARVELCLRVIIVDNASTEPLDTVPVPPGLGVRFVRLTRNTGGSGGFNAGLALALQAEGEARADLLWLIDSDARVEPEALGALVSALEKDEMLAAVGSVLADARTGEVYELGGRINPRNGRFEQPLDVQPGADGLIDADYLAACSMLVRREAAERAGLMPDVFVNGDDVGWSMRLARALDGAGGRRGRLAVAPGSRARHPSAAKMQTWARYYVTRNAFGPIDDAGMGRRVRLRRALRETGRAVMQRLMGRPDLARLHIAGLRDACRGRTSGPAPEGTIRFEPFRPFSGLEEALKTSGGARLIAVHRRLELPANLEAQVLETAERISGVRPLRVGEASTPSATTGALRGLGRVLAGGSAKLAVVSAKGYACDWGWGRTVVAVAPEGFIVRRLRPAPALAGAFATGLSGVWWSLRLAVLRRTAPARTPRAESLAAALRAADAEPGAASPRTLTLSIVVLSYNRREALLRTLRHVLDNADTRGAEIIVVDNASDDGSADAVREAFGDAVKLVRLKENLGVAGFNRGAEIAVGDAVLILDDDSWPEPGAAGRALASLASKPDLGAVTFHRRHPRTGGSEWPFENGAASGAQDDWPDMGCANLVRRSAWESVGGYESGYFLYRNDTDLALKLMGAGWDIRYEPACVVLHDSPIVVRKSTRWLRLATRNWVWMSRRHGRGGSGVKGLLLGWAWAHRLAGARPGAQWAALRGALAGLFTAPPELEHDVTPDGRAFRRLIELKMKYRGG